MDKLDFDLTSASDQVPRNEEERERDSSLRERERMSSSLRNVKLHVYSHCPFCVRIELVSGLVVVGGGGFFLVIFGAFKESPWKDAP